MKGFIVFEGCEGVGKSTQLRFLKEYLEKVGRPAVFTREPGGTPLAEEIRQLILTKPMSAETEAALFAAARCDHIDNLILPSLKEGKLVICDRYIDSSLAYQAYARGLGEDFILKMNDYAVRTCMPEAVVFLDLNPLESWRRKKGKVIENDRIESEADAFHLAVYDGYKKLAAKCDRYLCVESNIDKNVTAQNVLNALRGRGIIE
ncbi:MAG: dTMP kinase [Clostridia bacterium]|nr:dTMP kinase [Clostridia bacterium]